MRQPDPGPVPAIGFARSELPVETITTGTRLVRLHLSDFDPLFFGRTGNNRFDDPANGYGVCYLAMTREGAFAETCLRAVGARFVALSFLEARSFSEIEVAVPLRLVSLHGPGLARIGATATVPSGPHGVAQQWSRAIHGHPAEPDGIAYRSNHDNSQLCVALFERVRDSLIVATTQPITSNTNRLAELLARYDVGLG